MVIRKRPEKDTKNPPGQIVDKTLGDYIERKYSLPEKTPLQRAKRKAQK
jgi:hypothetical protein